MTTIAAVGDGVGYVAMAADSLTTVYDRPIPTARKIRRLPLGDTTEQFLLGFCGDGALPNVITAGLRTEAPDEDLQGWADAIARAVTEIAVEAGVTEAGHLDGHVLLGCRGQLWTIVHAQAIYHADHIAALGSGEGPAIGAIDAILSEQSAQFMPHLAEKAVAIAIRRDKHSGGAVQVEHLVTQGQP